MTDRLIRMGSLAILLKRRLKKPSLWFVLLLGLITLRLVGTAVLPDASNTEVGLMDSGGVYASAITKELLGGRSVYRYRLYTDRSALFDDVASGRLDCGFILDSRLDQAAESGDLTACADAVVSTASTKASAVKEEIFTILLSKYSDQLLSDQCDRGQIFKENTEEAKQALLESSRSLASGDAVLQVFFEDAGTGELTAASSLHEGEAYTENRDSAENQRTARARTSGRAAAVLIFGAARFFAAGRFAPGYQAFRSALSSGAARVFAVTDILLPLLIFTMMTDALLLISGTLPLSALPRLLLALAAGVPLTAVWAAVFASLFRNETICLFTIVALLLLASVLMASDLTAAGILTKSFRSLRFLLPDTWYAYLSGAL